MQDNPNTRICINCGRPVESDQCPYCNKDSFVDTSKSYDDIPFTECKKATFDFWGVIFPLFMGIPFTAAGSIPLVIFFINKSNEPLWVYIELAIFFVVGLCFTIAALTKIIRTIIISLNGTEINGYVIDCETNNTYYNGRPGHVLIIKIDTDEGPKRIKYNLSSPTTKYDVQSMVVLKQYKHYFRIM